MASSTQPPRLQGDPVTYSSDIPPASGATSSSGRGMAIASFVLSLIALGVSASIGFLAVLGEALGAGAQASAQLSSTCVSWATYVTEEQGDPKWKSLSTAEVDRRIDRVGTVLFSRIAAYEDLPEPTPKATSGTATPESASPLPTATSATSPSPTEDSSPFREVSIAEYCGSAAEFRRASSSDQPLKLR